MQWNRLFLWIFLLVPQLAMTGNCQEGPYTQHENLVYAESHGIGLLMDVFVPKGDKNGLGIVDVMSGAWHSDRGKIRDHTRAQTFHILCKKGYTVFAIRPGSVTKFSVPEMRQNLNHGILWVKDHAKAYEVDPDRLGMMGASAGGHLACLAAVTADDGSSKDAQGKSTGNQPIDPQGNERLSLLVRRLAFPEGITNPTTDEAQRLITQISPARLVSSKAPPFLLIHGDADPLVPLQQSETMVAALKKAGVSAELIVKPGGGHPWPTMHEEMAILADWFDKQLASH